MWKTALFLLLTIIIIPFIAFSAGVSLGPEQKAILADLLKIYIIAIALCFITSTITGNHSQVDKLWSIMPVVYAWLICIRSGYEPRLALMAAVVSIWGARLTYNFARRGGYKTISIKVGLSKTFAEYNLESFEEACNFLNELVRA